MPWFRVDDGFHSHPKVLTTPPAALGLWVVAGSWSSAHLTDGAIPDRVLPLLLPDAEKLARALVTAGLWKRVRGGYQFHDWTHRNPTKRTVEKARKSNAERQRAWQEAQRNAVSNAVSNPVSNSAPTQPFPYTGTGLSQGDRRAPPRASPNPHFNSNPNPGEGAAGRHPSAKPLTEAEREAHVNGQPPARGQTVHDHANAIRQTITQEPQP